LILSRAAAIGLLAVLAPALQPREAGLPQLKQVVEASNAPQASSALAILAPLARRYPSLADYFAYWTARAHVVLKDHAAAVRAVEPVFRQSPESPLAGQAALLAAESLLELNNPQGTVTMLARVAEPRLPQPGSLFTLARAREAVGDRVAAAIAWQTVFFGYPASEQAKDAREALGRLESSLGAAYPPPMPSSRFGRAERLVNARRYADARAEYLAMRPLLDGSSRELARVRAAATLHRARQDSAAYQELEALELEDPEADAERLHWLAATARRLDRVPPMDSALAELARRAPESTWRLRALIAAGDSYLVDNRRDEFLPHYAACAGGFPGDSRAAYCDWKTVWAAWLARSPEATDRLKQHLIKFPSSEKAGAALYWLGQSASNSGDPAAARDYLTKLNQHFPNFYYSVLARQLLSRPGMRNGQDSSKAQQFLASLKLPARERVPDFTVSPAAQKRIERARLLRSAGLEQWAEIELRFAARNGDSTWALAMELSETAAARRDYARSVRYIIGTVPGYLFLPRDAAPARFWRLAFPFPFRAMIEKYARERSVDPYLMAALIRQESIFDPGVISSAGAVGLTQIMPPTGRSLARRLKLGYRAAYLKRPEYNIRLGTFNLGNLIAAFDGRVEDALAAYNAGPGRPTKWRQWGPFRDPREFVETIPFTQTRDYVQIIMRNADIYRWLYAGTSAPPEAVESKAEPKRAVKPAPGKSSKKTGRPASRARKAR
jgi:soluble lytic murein transglycosylase